MMQRPWRVLLTGLLFIASSACFLQKPGVPATMGWAFSYQLLVMKMLSRLTYNPILWRHFLSRSSFLSDDSNLCQVDIKTSQHTSPAETVLLWVYHGQQLGGGRITALQASPWPSCFVLSFYVWILSFTSRATSLLVLLFWNVYKSF